MSSKNSIEICTIPYLAIKNEKRMLNKVQRRNSEIPLIIMAVLVLTSFLPLIQIFVMTLNGAIMYPLYSIADSDEIASKYIFVTNSTMSLIGLILFYVSNKMSWTTVAAIFVVFFLFPLMGLIFGFIKTEMYFLQNLVAGFAVGLILLVVALLKREPKRYSQK